MLPTITKKICLIGDFGVGKTSLIRRFVERQFSDSYLSSVGVKISRKNIVLENVNQRTLVQLIVWDLEGNNKFKQIGTKYLQGASAAIIVGDVTRPETLEHMTQYLEIFSFVNPQALIAVTFNKVDLVDEETTNYILNHYQFKTQQVMTYVSSAKTGMSVDTIFENVARTIISKQKMRTLELKI
jgi:small GTP-binding protein